MGASGAACAGDVQRCYGASVDSVGKDIPHPKREGGVQVNTVGRGHVEILCSGGYLLAKKECYALINMAARSLVWKIVKGCIGTNNKLNIQVKQYSRATDGRSAFFAIESFMLGNNHSSSFISAA